MWPTVLIDSEQSLTHSTPNPQCPQCSMSTGLGALSLHRPTAVCGNRDHWPTALSAHSAPWPTGEGSVLSCASGLGWTWGRPSQKGWLEVGMGCPLWCCSVKESLDMPWLAGWCLVTRCTWWAQRSLITHLIHSPPCPQPCCGSQIATKNHVYQWVSLSDTQN